MSAHRFFLTAPLPASSGPVALPLSAADLHHAASVLRVRAGEQIEAVEPGADSAWLVRVVEVSPAALIAEPVERLVAVHHPHITLVQGVAKGEKMDAIVRQAVEVGATEVVPVLTQRSVVRLDGAKRAAKGERWRRIAESAAKQAHRIRVPLVHDPLPLAEAYPLLAEHDGVVVLWEDAAGTGLKAAVESWVRSADARIALVVGPEGGLSHDEVDALAARGARVVTLGPGILRTETAAVVAVALLAYEFGALGPLGPGDGR